MGSTVTCSYECYKIGGPWIAENPDCPEHGKRNRVKYVTNEEAKEFSEKLGLSFMIVNSYVIPFQGWKSEEREATEEEREMWGLLGGPVASNE